MSHTVPIQIASSKLSELVLALGPGDEIVLTNNDVPVARIVPNVPTASRMPGAWKGKLEIIDDSDDAILEQFQDYLP